MDVVTLGMAKADAKKNYVPAAAFATERAPVPVVDFRARPGYNGNSNGTDTGGNYRYKHTAIVTSAGLRYAFGNYSCVSGIETDGANDITVRASLEEPTSGKFAPVFFGGKRDVVIAPGATVWSDPIGFQVSRGQVFYSRTYVTVASGQTWPKTIVMVNTSGEGVMRGTSTTDLTMGGAITTSNESGYGPMAIWGLPTIPLKTVVGIVGDSISAGYGEAAPNTDRGYIERGLNNQIAFQSVAAPSSQVAHWRDGRVDIHWRRVALLDRCTDIIQEHGVNDLPAVLTTTQQYLIELWRLCTNRGAKVRQTTITPSSTSTDAFATVANQTPGANESKRVALNTWFRDGAPILNGVAAAAGSSATGTLRAGQTGHPLVGIIEVADLAESARNSGKWVVGYTTDGIHPTTAGATALAPAVAALVGTAFTPAV